MVAAGRRNFICCLEWCVCVCCLIQISVIDCQCVARHMAVRRVHVDSSRK